MRKFKGFTLIELLVVISIIAVLMSIMMPALGKVREQAKTVVCQARIREWGTMFKLYTTDNNAKFPPGYKGSGGSYTAAQAGGLWINALRPYYGEAGPITCCPTATKTNHADPTFKAWKPNEFYTPYPDKDYGSYGINYYIYKPEGYSWGKPKDFFWASENIRQAQNVPLFMDCSDMGTAPLAEDEAPLTRGDLTAGHWTQNNMKRVCLDRHNGVIDVVFADYSIRKVGLKELWKLKWHKQYDTHQRTPEWPEWMK